VSETGGIYQYRSRYYDSATGRFISEDPIGFGGSDANLYRYVFDSPVTFTDPTGLLINFGELKYGQWGQKEDPGLGCQIEASALCLSLGEVGIWPGVVCGIAAIPICNAVGNKPLFSPRNPQDICSVLTIPIPGVGGAVGGLACNALPTTCPEIVPAKPSNKCYGRRDLCDFMR
jgi:RHS repeat-associated protein